MFINIVLVLLTFFVLVLLVKVSNLKSKFIDLSNGKISQWRHDSDIKDAKIQLRGEFTTKINDLHKHIEKIGFRSKEAYSKSINLIDELAKKSGFMVKSEVKNEFSFADLLQGKKPLTQTEKLTVEKYIKPRKEFQKK